MFVNQIVLASGVDVVAGQPVSGPYIPAGTTVVTGAGGWLGMLLIPYVVGLSWSLLDGTLLA